MFAVTISEQGRSRPNARTRRKPAPYDFPAGRAGSGLPSEVRSPPVAAAGGGRYISNRSSSSQTTAHRLRRGPLPVASAWFNLSDLNSRLVLPAGRGVPSPIRAWSGTCSGRSRASRTITAIRRFPSRRPQRAPWASTSTRSIPRRPEIAISAAKSSRYRS